MKLKLKFTLKQYGKKFKIKRDIAFDVLKILIIFIVKLLLCHFFYKLHAVYLRESIK